MIDNCLALVQLLGNWLAQFVNSFCQLHSLGKQEHFDLRD